MVERPRRQGALPDPRPRRRRKQCRRWSGLVREPQRQGCGRRKVEDNGALLERRVRVGDVNELDRLPDLAANVEAMGVGIEAGRCLDGPRAIDSASIPPDHFQPDRRCLTEMNDRIEGCRVANRQDQAHDREKENQSTPHAHLSQGLDT